MRFCLHEAAHTKLMPRHEMELHDSQKKLHNLLIRKISYT